MPRRNAVESLPSTVKAWLDKALAEGGFQRYRLLEDELRARGYAISKSTLQRYGAAFEERIASLRLATEQARAVVEASPDKEGATNEALMRLVQEKLFDVLLNLNGETKGVDLPKITRSIADLCRAAVTQKRYAEEVREQARREAQEKLERATDAVAGEAQRASLTAAQILERVKAIYRGEA